MIRLATIFSDNAVLQRDRPVPVWGWSAPEDAVRVTLAGQRLETVAAADGRWSVTFEPLAAGGPYELRAEGKAPGAGEAASKVLVGEVWLCSGQSNMDWTLEKSLDAEAHARAADLPSLRLFTVAQKTGRGLAAEVEGSWQVGTPRNAPAFSAVAYHFGRRLHRELGVPLGLVVSSWGGTTAQAWTSGEGLASEAGAEADSRELAAFLEQIPERAEADYQAARKRFLAALPQDAGNRGLAEGWADAAFDDSAWKSMELPRIWFDAGYETNGVFWFRREVTLPAAWQGRDLELSLGALDKNDDTYVNGARVGGMTWAENPDSWKAPRVYRVAGPLATGRLVVALRIMSQYTGGGTGGPAKAMFVRPWGSDEPGLALTGPWRFAIEQDFGRVRGPGEPAPPIGPNIPSMLYNQMIAPLVPMALRGVIWYQGESNDGDTARYYTLFPLLIRDWRRVWGQQLPFLFVQLANYQRGRPQRVADDSRWAEIREAQSRARTLPATAMAVALDVGESLDIHPKNKEAVGQRLARAALATVYGQNVAYRGPSFSGLEIAGSALVVTLDQAQGLRSRTADVQGFAVAGADRVFHEATASIEGARVRVASPRVARPVAVRYGWEDDPVCTLENADGLPAEPFRSDSWPVGADHQVEV
ncbi:MAG: sialate O-acetylesterase [Spirochaetales bacterium]